ncbi:MAG TPA: FHA domain-containing protein [Myxococcales bacterium LLY-WYZ-16_1]|jgi:hypothetical protein|nr:FHA domain-containing protein [Myxococcales bacterium LLY-WYZ-16_1]
MEVLFRKTMVAAFAGLFAWLVHQLVLQSQPEAWTDATKLALTLGLFGALVSGAVAGAETHFEVDRIAWPDVAVGALSGVVVCGLTGWVLPAAVRQVSGGAGGTLGTVAYFGVWLLAGVCIGLTSSIRLRRHDMERLRNGLLGGLLGGVAGALLLFVTGGFALGPVGDQIMQAAGYALVGGAVALGVGVAPGLTARGELVFRQSESAAARAKLAGIQRISLGKGAYAVGSRPLLAGREGALVVLIPDNAVRPVHCWIVFAQGGFQLFYPEDNRPGSPGHDPVLADGKPLAEGTRLRNGAQLTIGKTTFDFELKQDHEERG